jgi:23S rRNA (cytosine1962-C5)-methyltransferase
MDPQTSKPLPKIELSTSPDWKDYELLDSGNGAKLERYGSYTFIRPEPQAVWKPSLPEKLWQQAHAVFQTTAEENGGHWQFRREIVARWPMAYKGLKFWAQTSASRHLGVFPEQACHWDWIQQQVRSVTASQQRPLKVLNLFGYTGLASLAAAEAGAQVTHVDASKKVVTWARENQTLSGLAERPVRWIVDDALKFVEREVRRASSYDGLILDPPKFGRGPKGEVWEFYRLLPALLESCRTILNSRPAFVVLTAYAIQASALTVYFGLQNMLAGLEGTFSLGELVTVESSAGRAISNAIYARWAS